MKHDYMIPQTEVAKYAAQLTLLSGSPTPPPPEGDILIDGSGPHDDLNSL